MDIKVGEYIRLKDDSVDIIIEDVRKHKHQRQFMEGPLGEIIECTCLCPPDYIGRYGQYNERDIIKHSKDIFDLLEDEDEELVIKKEIFNEYY